MGWVTCKVAGQCCCVDARECCGATTATEVRSGRKDNRRTSRGFIVQSTKTEPARTAAGKRDKNV